jgi:hypothetical protein
MGFVVDKVALGQAFSENFGFPYQFSFYRLLHIHHLSFGAGTIGKLVTDVPSGLSLTPPQEIKKLYPLYGGVNFMRRPLSHPPPGPQMDKYGCGDEENHTPAGN